MPSMVVLSEGNPPHACGAWAVLSGSIPHRRWGGQAGASLSRPSSSVGTLQAASAESSLHYLIAPSADTPIIQARHSGKWREAGWRGGRGGHRQQADLGEWGADPMRCGTASAVHPA